MPFRLFLTILLLTAMPASAAFKWTKPDGTVVFSDNPPHPDAEQIKLPLTPNVASHPLPKKTATKKPAMPPIYTLAQFQHPVNDQAIRDNAGNISVVITTEPALIRQSNHQVVIKLDGETVATLKSLSTVLTLVDRGTHTLSAHVIDAAGKVLISTSEIQFHLLKSSIRR